MPDFGMGFILGGFLKEGLDANMAAFFLYDIMALPFQSAMGDVRC